MNDINYLLNIINMNTKVDVSSANSGKLYLKRFLSVE